MEASDGGAAKLKADMEAKYHALLTSVANLIANGVAKQVPGAALILTGKKQNGEQIYATLQSPVLPNDPLRDDIQNAVDETMRGLNSEPKLLDALKRAGFFNADS